MSPHRFLLLATLLAPAAIAQITPGNLVVVRVGDGAAALSPAATPQFLEQFDTLGAPVGLPIALPTTQSLPQLEATVAGSATSEGFVTQSTDGNYLVCVGYAAPVGTGSVAGTASASVPRVVARIALNGSIDTSTCITNLFSAGNIRSGATQDGSQFWTAGSKDSIVLVDFAQITGTTIGTTTTNLRVVGIADGQLYTTSGSGTTTRCVNSVGAGVPTTAGQTIDPLNGMSSGTASPYDYWFADASTCYVADDRSAASGGGLQKWTESGGLWTLVWTIAPGPGNVTCRGLNGIRDQSGTTLYVTTTESNANRLLSLVDTGPLSTFNLLATAAANTAYRGVRFVRTPSSVSFAGVGCTTSAGIPTVGTTGGAPVSGNANFALTCGNAPAFAPFIAIVGINQILGPGSPISFAGFPPCAVLYSPPDALVNGTCDGAGNGVIPLGLVPPDTSFWGLPFTVQNAVYDPAFYPTYAPFYSFGFSDGMQVVIGN
ncbi:MAG: hypothetical protein JNM25_11660 [Planctomycetes bacterium]|nr:hypothetical protein [Planctomycetota bacterium]